jgi:hypothetical protein
MIRLIPATVVVSMAQQNLIEGVIPMAIPDPIDPTGPLKRTYKNKNGTGTVLVWEGGDKAVNDEGNVSEVYFVGLPIIAGQGLRIIHKDGTHRHVTLSPAAVIDIWGFEDMEKADPKANGMKF